MSKKNWTAGLFALALTLGIVSVAAAAGPSLADPSALSGSTFAPLGAAAGIGPQDPPNPPGPRGGPGRGPLRGRPHLSGEITAIGDNQFTLTTAGNNEVTVEVDESTSYLGSLDGFDDLEPFVLDVVGDEACEGLHVRSNKSNSRRTERLQAMHECAGARHDGRCGAFAFRHFVQTPLGLTVVPHPHAHDRHEARITDDVHARVRQFGGAPVRIGIHGSELLPRHLLHPHAAGVKREALGLHGLASTKHRRDLRLHRGVGAWNDLADAVRHA